MTNRLMKDLYNVVNLNSSMMNSSLNMMNLNSSMMNLNSSDELKLEHDELLPGLFARTIQIWYASR